MLKIETLRENLVTDVLEFAAPSFLNSYDSNWRVATIHTVWDVYIGTSLVPGSRHLFYGEHGTRISSDFWVGTVVLPIGEIPQSHREISESESRASPFCAL